MIRGNGREWLEYWDIYWLEAQTVGTHCRHKYQQSICFALLLSQVLDLFHYHIHSALCQEMWRNHSSLASYTAKNCEYIVKLWLFNITYGGVPTVFLRADAMRSHAIDSPSPTNYGFSTLLNLNTMEFNWYTHSLML